MIRSASAVVAKGGVLREVVSGPPLTIRKIFAERPDVCSLCLVGSAAGPLSGDDVRLSLTVQHGAQARLSATGASIAQGRPGGAAGSLFSRIELGSGAVLFAEPGPIIAAEGSSLSIKVELELADTSLIHWRELLVLGRAGEQPGSVALEWSVRRQGRPVLIQTVDLRHAARWPGMLAGHRVIATCLVSGPDVPARTMVDSPSAVCQKIDDHTALVTVLGSDTSAVQAQLAELIAGLDPSMWSRTAY